MIIRDQMCLKYQIARGFYELGFCTFDQLSLEDEFINYKHTDSGWSS